MGNMLLSFPFWKAIRFAVVGCSGVIVDFGVTFLLKENLVVNKYLASAVGFGVAATSNYFLNRLWTFNSADPQMLLQYVRFMIVAIVGVGLSNVIIWILHEKLNISFYGAKGISILLVMAWNFTVNTMITFA